MSFYELYEILINKKIKFSKLALMDDPNEGIGLAISNQLPSLGVGFNNKHQEILNYHQNTLNRTFISSWTKNKDSMAMWLLYSKNKDSIRVKTSIKKLKSAVTNYWEKEHWRKHLESPEGTIQTDLPGEIKDISYDDIQNILKKIKHLHKKYREKVNLLYKSEFTEEIRLEKFHELRKDVRTKGIQLSEKIRNFKSDSYSFEEELRASIELTKRNDLPHEDWERNKDSHSLEYIFGEATSDYEDLEFPNTIYLPIDDSFIEEICFDPRMPTFKQKIMKNIFKIKDSKYVTSNVFGVMTKEIDFGMSHYGNA